MLRQTDTVNSSLSDLPLPGRRFLGARLKIPMAYCNAGAIVSLLDFVTIVVLALGTYNFYGFAASHKVSWGGLPVAAGLINAFLFCVLMGTRRLYQPAQILKRDSEVFSILNIWLLAFLSVLALGFLVHASESYSRGAAVLFFASGALVLPTGRVAAKRMFRYLIAHRLLEGRRRVVLFGETNRLTSYGMAERLQGYGYNVVGRFAVNPVELRSITKGLTQLGEFVKANRVDEIFLAFDGGRRNVLQAVMQRLLEFPISVRLLFDQNLDHLLSLPIVDLGAAKSVKLQGGPLKSHAQFVKRSFDIGFAISGLILLAPFFLAVAIAIRLDSRGPVIFRQRRVGFSGRVFQIYKFRSMTTMDDGNVVLQATRKDSRVTRVGRFIRRSSIDELPQLLNVLRGEMSIVGPRPHALSHDDEYTRAISTYALRHHMKPGITGWAQVNGCRGETPTVASMERRVSYDIWYIKHWSLILDFIAVARTVVQFAFPKDVY